MHGVRKYRYLAIAALTAALVVPAPAALAVNRDMVQLQTQVQQLQDAVARLQQSNDERMGVLRDLVQQTADSVNRMTGNIDALQKKLAAQQEAEGAKVDQVSGQVQSLNDSLDELKARLGRMEKLLQDVQNQQQTMNANMNSGAPSTPAAGVPPVDAGVAPGADAPAPVVRRGGKASAAVPANVVPDAAPAAPPVQDLYQTALRDFVSAKYTLAAAEFGDITKFYPEDALAGNSFFYLGEINYKAGKYNLASKNYDRVLEQFPGNSKVPVAHLRKGQSLIALKQTDAGVRELRSLIQRFPNSPEAAQARSKLSAMGVHR